LQAHDQLVELQRDVARLQMLNNEWEHREAVHTQTRKQLSEAQQALTEMSLRHDTLLHQHRFEVHSLAKS
jgi:chaperonin cofactor prefoldin